MILCPLGKKNVQSIAKESSIKLNNMLIGADKNVVTDANIYDDLAKENYSKIGKEENDEDFFQKFLNYKKISCTSTRDKILKGFDISQSNNTYTKNETRKHKKT